MYFFLVYIICVWIPQGIWIVSKYVRLKDRTAWNAATNKGAQDNRPECNHIPDKADRHINTSHAEVASGFESFQKAKFRGPREWITRRKQTEVVTPDLKHHRWAWPRISSLFSAAPKVKKAQENHESTSWALGSLLLIMAYSFTVPPFQLYLYKMPTCI